MASSTGSASNAAAIAAPKAAQFAGTRRTLGIGPALVVLPLGMSEGAAARFHMSAGCTTQ